MVDVSEDKNAPPRNEICIVRYGERGDAGPCSPSDRRHAAVHSCCTSIDTSAVMAFVAIQTLCHHKASNCVILVGQVSAMIMEGIVIVLHNNITFF